MWLNTQEYRGDSILLQQLVVTLSLKAVRGEVLRTDTAVLRGLEVLPSDGCLPLFAETRPGQREPEKTQSAGSAGFNKRNRPSLLLISCCDRTRKDLTEACSSYLAR